MEISPLKIPGAWLLSSETFNDSRGSFQEWFNSGDLKKLINYEFETKQANMSKSLKGVVRGIHYSLSTSGQAKLITCLSGKIRDVVVDIREGSPTFGNWIYVDIDSFCGKSLLIEPGLGHGFSVLEENTCVAYLLSSPYSPVDELEIFPLDKTLNINWNIPESEVIISKKDLKAPGLISRQIRNQLPRYEAIVK